MARKSFDFWVLSLCQTCIARMVPNCAALVWFFKAIDVSHFRVATSRFAFLRHSFSTAIGTGKRVETPTRSTLQVVGITSSVGLAIWLHQAMSIRRRFYRNDVMPAGLFEVSNDRLATMAEEPGTGVPKSPQRLTSTSMAARWTNCRARAGSAHVLRFP